MGVVRFGVLFCVVLFVVGVACGAIERWSSGAIRLWSYGVNLGGEVWREDAM